MSMLFVILFFLRVSLAVEQSETFQPSVLRRRLLVWAEHAGAAAAAEVREAAARLEDVVALADNPDVQRLAELYNENHHLIHHCGFTPELAYGLQGLPSCINVTADLANITLLAIYGYQLADQLAGCIVDVLNELNTCSEESIWKQIICYKHAFGDIQGDIKEYSVDCNNFLSNATVVLTHIEVDIKSCFSFTEKFSVDWVESKIELCKLDLKEQQLL